MKTKIYIIIALILGLGFGGYFFRDKLVFAGIAIETVDCKSRYAATNTVAAYIYMASSTATSTPAGCPIDRANLYALDLNYVASTTGAFGSTGSAATLSIEYSFNDGEWFQGASIAAPSAGASAIAPLVYAITPTISATSTYHISLVDIPGKYIRFNLRQAQGNKTDNAAYLWALQKREEQN